MGVEWDEAKRLSNLRKHKIDFIDAAKVFVNPTLERPDDRDDYGEERIICIGEFEGSYFVVVYTWRGENRRIISAWRAGRDEQETYDAAVHG